MSNIELAKSSSEISPQHLMENQNEIFGQHNIFIDLWDSL